jgi:hypothetical protein
VRDETILPVHVPDPSVSKFDFNACAPVFVHNALIDLVGQIETSFGFDNEPEHWTDIFVLAIKLQLDVGLVFFEILRTHTQLRSTATLLCRDPKGPGATRKLGPTNAGENTTISRAFP